MELTHARLKEALNYDPETGEFTWIKAICKKVVVGKIAGCLSKGDGYIKLRIDKQLYCAHRLAWFYMTGGWPPLMIDHKDTDRANNRWSNLRLAGQTQQNANMRLRSDNKSGFKGVSWQEKSSKWYASICVDGNSMNLGLYADIEDAKAAYATAANRYFGEFARP